MNRLLKLSLAVVLLAAACTSDTEPTTTTEPAPGSSTTTAPTTTSVPATTTTIGAIPAELTKMPFGTLTAVAPLSNESAYAGPDHPTSLNGVLVADWINDYLAANDAKDTLTTNGFVVVPGETRLFQQTYQGAEYGGYPVFVTTDAAYHVWHLAFDKILRETEQQELLPALEDMLTRVVALARSQEDELAGTTLAEPASRVTQFYEAAATLLGLDLGPIGPLAQQEVDLATAADQVATSPTIGIELDSGFSTVKTDYTLFRPRGHYTRNADLERYFRAMSQLGNNAFLLEPETLQLGILASRVLLADPTVVEEWQTIYEPTAFLVGAADDYTPFELSDVIEAAVPTGWTDLSAFADAGILQQVAAGLLAARPVMINPEAASIRVMGARLVVDSYIIDQLVAPNVPGRGQASPLDLAAAFGSEWARGVQEAAGATDYPGYAGQLAAMQDLIANRTIDDWGRTVYDSWLYAVEPMWQPHGAAFPDFMQTDAWAAKSHQTGFGSYTELKHDTILYAKQAVAEGGGDEPPPPPRNWVEPDPVVFARLGAVTALLRDGLQSRDLLPDVYDKLLQHLTDFYGWLGGIAADELAGRPIGNEDNLQLGWIGSTLEGFWAATSDADLDPETGPDSFSGLVADIMRGFDEEGGGVLELGTGYVDEIFVLVPNDEGVFQVAIGGVYSYYEFWNRGPRLTDEEWRTSLDTGTAPDRPAWEQVFLAGKGPQPTTLEAGLFCRDLEARGRSFWDAAVYWVSEGSPDRMDADQNGIPCETIYPAEEIDSFLHMGRGYPSGLTCEQLNLPDDPDTWLVAIAYWMLEDEAPRLDPNGDGLPCETTFSAANIQLMIDSVYDPSNL